MSAEVKAMLSIGGVLLLAVVSLHIYLGTKIDSLGGRGVDVITQTVRLEEKVNQIEDKVDANNAMLKLLIENIVDDKTPFDKAGK